MFSSLRYIFGFVRFSATGGFVERFVNLAALEKVPIWNSRTDGSTFTGETTIIGYRRLMKPAEKSGVTLHRLGKHGLPFLYKNLHPRIGLFIGVIIFAVLFTLYSKTIWRVDVSGNTTIKDSEILEAAESAGLYEGVFRGNVKTATVRKVITDKLPSLAWVNVNVDGSRANIEVLEGENLPEVEEEEIPANVVSTADGVITSMSVYDGEKCVNIGDAVCEGDLLVSGTIYYENTKATVLHRADAKIYAQVEKQKSITVKKKVKKTVYTGKSVSKDVLWFWGVKIPLYLFPEPEGNWQKSEAVKQITVFGVKVPIRIYKTTYREQTELTVTLTEDEAREQAQSEISVYEKEFPDDTSVLKKSVKLTEKDDKYVFRYTFSLEENIAKQVDLDVDKK